MNNLKLTLMRLSVVLLGLGMLAVAGCDSCRPNDPLANVPTRNSYTCGPGSHLEGTQCVGDAVRQAQPVPARETTPLQR
ncbi:MAG: hypothetical protein AAB036_02715 [Elusimicrobiota bacterium]